MHKQLYIKEKARWLAERQRIKLYHRNKRLIFCINSGRCGSQFLASLLGSCANVTASHESMPFMTHDIIDLVNTKDYHQTFWARSFKAGFIRRSLSNLPARAIHCETSQMFIKTFFDIAICAFPGQVEVIILRRYLPAVLKSYLELDYFNISRDSFRWMTSPNAITRAITCIDQDAKLDTVDLIISYLIDIEARAQRFIQNYSSIKTYQVSLEDISQPLGSQLLLHNLSLEPTSQTELILSHGKANARSSSKIIDVDINYCKERIFEYIEKAKSRGIKVPDSLFFSN
jgi:hypothetical protein